MMFARLLRVEGTLGALWSDGWWGIFSVLDLALSQTRLSVYKRITGELCVHILEPSTYAACGVGELDSGSIPRVGKIFLH